MCVRDSPALHAAPLVRRHAHTRVRGKARPLQDIGQPRAAGAAGPPAARAAHPGVRAHTPGHGACRPTPQLQPRVGAPRVSAAAGQGARANLTRVLAELLAVREDLALLELADELHKVLL